jgi:hypothetical protein
MGDGNFFVCLVVGTNYTYNYWCTMLRSLLVEREDRLMSKKKDKPQVINNIQELNLEIDYDKLAEAIVKAKQIEEENAAKKKASELEEWQRSIGINKHEDKKGLKRKFFVFFNSIKVFLNLLFFSKKKKAVMSPKNKQPDEFFNSPGCFILSSCS